MIKDEFHHGSEPKHDKGNAEEKSSENENNAIPKLESMRDILASMKNELLASMNERMDRIEAENEVLRYELLNTPKFERPFTPDKANPNQVPRSSSSIADRKASRPPVLYNTPWGNLQNKILEATYNHRSRTNKSGYDTGDEFEEVKETPQPWTEVKTGKGKAKRSTRKRHASNSDQQKIPTESAYEPLYNNEDTEDEGTTSSDHGHDSDSSSSSLSTTSTSSGKVVQKGSKKQKKKSKKKKYENNKYRHISASRVEACIKAAQPFTEETEEEYRSFKLSIEKLAVAYGWPDYILDSNAPLFEDGKTKETPKGKIFRIEASMILQKLINKKFHKRIRSALDKSFDAQNIWRKFQQEFGPQAKFGKFIEVKARIYQYTMSVQNENVAEYGTSLRQLCTTVKDMGYPVPENEQVEIYLKGLLNVLKPYALEVRQQRDKDPSKFDTLDKVKAAIERRAGEFGVSNFKKKHGEGYSQNLSHKRGKNKKGDTSKELSQNQQVEGSGSGKTTKNQQTEGGNKSSDCKFGNSCCKPKCKGKHPEGYNLEEAKEKMKKKNNGGCSTCNSIFHSNENCKSSAQKANYDLGHMEVRYSQHQLAVEEEGENPLSDLSFPMEVRYTSTSATEELAQKPTTEQGPVCCPNSAPASENKKEVPISPHPRNKDMQFKMKSCFKIAVRLFWAMAITWFCTGAGTRTPDQDLSQLFSYTGNLPSVATAPIVEVKGLYPEELPYLLDDGIHPEGRLRREMFIEKFIRVKQQAKCAKNETISLNASTQDRRKVCRASISKMGVIRKAWRLVSNRKFRRLMPRLTPQCKTEPCISRRLPKCGRRSRKNRTRRQKFVRKRENQRRREHQVKGKIVFMQAAFKANVLKFEKFRQLHVNQSGGEPVFLLDSGAEVNSYSSETTPEENPQRLQGVSVSGFVGGSRPVTKKAIIRPPSTEDVRLTAIDVPGSKYNLISVRLLDEAGCTIIFKGGEAKVYDRNNKLILYGKLVDNLYKIQVAQSRENEKKMENIIRQLGQNHHYKSFDSGTLMMYHEALGHRSFNYVRRLLGYPPSSANFLNPHCDVCLKAQYKNPKVPTEALTVAPRKGYRLCSDTSDKYPRSDVDGLKDVQRFVLSVDEYTGKLFLGFVQRKDQVKKKVTGLIDHLNNELSPQRVAEHQSDGGSEFLNKEMDKMLEERKVQPRNSDPYCHYQNGVVEKAMDYVQRTARALMIKGNAPESDWVWAVKHAVYLYNMLPNPDSEISPNERWSGVPERERPEDLLSQTLFCRCEAKVYVHGKREERSRPCIYLGKSSRTPGYVVRVLGGKKTGKEVRTASVLTWDGTSFPYTDMKVPRPMPKRSFKYDSDTADEENQVELKDDHPLTSESSSSSEENKFSSDSNETDSESEEECRSQDEKHDKHEERKSNNAPKPPQSSAPQWVPDGKIGKQDAYEVESILDCQRRKKKGRRTLYYKVKWAGGHDPSWEPARNVSAHEKIDEFWHNVQDLRTREKKNKLHPGEQPLKVTYPQASKLKGTLAVGGMVYNMCQMGTYNLALQAEQNEPNANPFKDLFNPETQEKIKDPKNEKELENHPYKEFFHEARLKERFENLGWKTYKEVPRSTVPAGAKILRTVTAYKTKYNARGEIEKFKTRVCVDGSRIKLHESETYEQIAGFPFIRMLLCLATRFQMYVAVTDVKNFFLQARLPTEKEYYVEIPAGWAVNDPNTHVAKVLAPWYGLPEAAKISGDQLAAVLEKNGMQRNPWFPKVFYKWDGDDFVACGTHIDDQPWIATSKEKLQALLTEIDKEFKLEVNWSPDKILGCNLEYNREKGIMKIHQGSFNRSAYSASSHKKVEAPGYIPYKVNNPEVQHHPEKKVNTAQEIRNYQSRVGNLIWGLHADPSVAYAVSKCAQAMQDPQPDDWKRVAHVEAYKAWHPEMGPVWRAANPPEKLKKGHNLDCLTWFADSDWGKCERTGKSHSGWSLHLGNSGMFDWKSKRQTCTSQSSCEAETICNKECTCDLIMYRNGLTAMGFTFSKPSPVCQDNTSAIALCESDKHHSRTRHFRLHSKFLRDCYVKRIAWYPWIPTKHMKGDLFNKLHQPGRHKELLKANKISAMPIKLLEDTENPEWDFEQWRSKLVEQHRQEKEQQGKPGKK